MMPPTILYVGTCRVVIVISCVVVFSFGAYFGQDYFFLHIKPRYESYNGTMKKSGKINPINITDQLSFHDLGLKYGTDKITVYHYEIIYEKYLSKYIGSDVIFLEIGLGCGMRYGRGASAYLWRHYLGHRAEIHFIESVRKCAEEWRKTHGNKLNITVHIGQQEDVAFLNTVNSTKGYFDVIVDDGGHHMEHQITSFTHLFPKIRSEGIYAIEDVGSSYMRIHNAGYLVPTSTIEFIKRLIDDMQEDSPKKTTEVGQLILSMEILNQICFFTRK